MGRAGRAGGALATGNGEGIPGTIPGTVRKLLDRLPWAAWTPKLVEVLPTYTKADFSRDVLAGVTVGMVALPLAMAFGIASGVTPQAGLYTAVVGGFIAAVLGGSRIQVSGPTGAFVVIVAGIITQHGLSGLLMVTMMAGAILLFLGMTGLGNAVKFVPRPVVIGFTNGIALLIASTQLRDFLGLRMRSNPTEFFARMEMVWKYLDTVNWPALGLGVVSLAIILLMPKIAKRVPGSIVALVVGTVAVAAFDLRVTTIGSLFGKIPSGLPVWDLPTIRPDLILPLMPAAITVALLAALESLLSAVVADGMIGDRHNSSAELIGQGAANLIVPLVGGIPVTGAIARTATNYRSGGRTPIAAIVHAIVVALVVLLLAPLATRIPMATLAAVLFVVAYNMGEWKEIGTILRLDLPEKAVWLLTFVLTVMADLTIAVEVGMTLAALLYVYRVSQTTTVSPVTQQYIERGRVHVLQDKFIPPYVTVLRIHGPFLFGTTDKLAEETADLTYYNSVIILRLRNMTAIDATGMHALKVFHERVVQSGRDLILCGARQQPARFLKTPEFVEAIGAGNIVPHVQAALERAREIRFERARQSGVF